MVPDSKKKKKRKKPTPQRHRWFDHWLIANGDPLKRLVSEVINAVDTEERREKARRRARRAQDHRYHLDRIEAVVANLAYSVLNPPETGRLAVNTRNGERGRTRYENPALGKPFSPLLHLLQDIGLLSIKRPEVRRGEMQGVAPTPSFNRIVVEQGIDLSSFGRHRAEEVILLTRNTRGLNGENGVTRERIDYSDTQTTRRLRQAMRRLNAFLAAADISFVDDGKLPLVDPFERTLRRHFVLLAEQNDTRFDQSGRLFGGFWQNMKSDRRNGIRINGEPTVTLDYGSMFTRLAYAEIKATPPQGDLYAVPGLESYRSGVKMAMNCLLFDTSLKRRRWPSEMGIGVGSDDDAKRPRTEAALYEARLPEGSTVRKTKESILRLHPQLRPAWGRGLGYKLMHMESWILMSVLEELVRRDIPALGLHDGLLVAASQSQVADSVMRDVALNLTGHRIPVAEKN